MAPGSSNEERGRGQDEPRVAPDAAPRRARRNIPGPRPWEPPPSGPAGQAPVAGPVSNSIRRPGPAAALTGNLALHSAPMEVPQSAYAALPLPPMPEVILVAGPDRRAWSIDGDVWRVRQAADVESTITVNWALLRKDAAAAVGRATPLLSERALYLVRHFAATASPKLAAASMDAVLYAFRYFIRWLAANPGYWPADGRSFEWADFTREVIDAWYAAELQTTRKGGAVTLLRDFYRYGCDPDAPLPEFDERLYIAWKLEPIKQRSKSGRVDSLDPRTDPLDRDELDLIEHALLYGTAADPRDRAVAWLALETAGRPVEMHRLCVRHLAADDVRYTSVDPAVPPEISYRLTKSNAKRRAGGTEMLPGRPIHAKLGDLLMRLQHDHAELLAHLPPNGKRRRGPEGTDLDARLLWWINTNYASSINEALKRFVAAENIRTPRLPLPAPDADGNRCELLPVFVYRFRHGVATDRFAQGASVSAVQALLGHDGEETTRKSYQRNTPLNAVKMDEATRWATAPLVRRMRGQLERPDAPVAAPLIPGYVPHLHHGRALKVIGPIGKCAKEGPCDKNPVTSCFGCDSFVGRVDSVETLVELHGDFVEHLERGPGAQASPTTRMQLRNTILALEEWIAHIHAAHAEAARLHAAGDGMAGVGTNAGARRRGRGRA